MHSTGRNISPNSSEQISQQQDRIIFPAICASSRRVAIGMGIAWHQDPHEFPII